MHPLSISGFANARISEIWQPADSSPWPCQSFCPMCGRMVHPAESALHFLGRRGGLWSGAATHSLPLPTTAFALRWCRLSSSWSGRRRRPARDRPPKHSGKSAPTLAQGKNPQQNRRRTLGTQSTRNISIRPSAGTTCLPAALAERLPLEPAASLGRPHSTPLATERGACPGSGRGRATQKPQKPRLRTCDVASPVLAADQCTQTLRVTLPDMPASQTSQKLLCPIRYLASGASMCCACRPFQVEVMTPPAQGGRSCLPLVNPHVSVRPIAHTYNHVARRAIVPAHLATSELGTVVSL